MRTYLFFSIILIGTGCDAGSQPSNNLSTQAESSLESRMPVFSGLPPWPGGSGGNWPPRYNWFNAGVTDWPGGSGGSWPPRYNGSNADVPPWPGGSGGSWPPRYNWCNAGMTDWPGGGGDSWPPRYNWTDTGIRGSRPVVFTSDIRWKYYSNNRAGLPEMLEIPCFLNVKSGGFGGRSPQKITPDQLGCFWVMSDFSGPNYYRVDKKVSNDP